MTDPEPARRQFERFYRAQVRPLLAYALRRVARAEDAADVVSETMLVAWRRWADVPAGDEARLWLFGVARRVLANHRRSALRQHRLGSRLRRDLRRLVGQDHAAALLTNLTIDTALDRLSEEDREILRLTAWEGLDPHEIAVVLSIGTAAARTRLHRARRRLRLRLQEAGNEAEERPAANGHVRVGEHVLVRDSEDER